MLPDDLKMARVVPIYKKNCKNDPSNYRPVTVLNVISKIFEKVIYDQVEVYLTENNVLYCLQSGFRRSYSTDTCLIHLTDKIKYETDKGNFTGLVLLDLQKAFDTVNHKILLGKLGAIGLSENCVKWFKAYLSNRKQLTFANNTLSSETTVKCGVPQGSILGPLLFLVYVNDMISAVNCELFLYADDSALVVSGKSVKDIQDTLSYELGNIHEWLVDNCLSLHLGKTEAILFGPKRKLKSVTLDVECNGIKITNQTCVTYLGAQLDNNLSGENMANKVLKKVNARIKFLYRNVSYLNVTTRKMLASALIQCHYDYACSIWYLNLSACTKNKLQVAQNKTIRLILQLNSRTHLQFEHFSKANILPVQKRVEQIKLCHMFKINSKISPSYLINSFNRCTHGYTLRSLNNFQIYSYNNTGVTTFGYSATVLWNSLPNSTKECSSYSRFKYEVKRYLWGNFKKEATCAYVYK